MDPTDDDGAAAPPDGGPPVRLVTVNDVVSMNLGQFRKAAPRANRTWLIGSAG